MQHKTQKHNWLLWLLSVLASTTLTVVLIGSFLWAQNVGAIPGGRMNTDTIQGTITGTIAYQGRLMDGDGLGEPTTYTVSTRRYHVEATKAQVDNTVPLDMEIVNELCRDEDGCMVTVGMRDFDDAHPGEMSVSGPFRFVMSETSTHWRLSTAPLNTEGTDGDGVTKHIFRVHDCYFTDGEYTNRTGTDNSVQLGLLNFHNTYESKMERQFI